MRKFQIFFYLGFIARQDYFTHFQPSQLLGGAKTGDPKKNHLQAEFDLSHMWPELGLSPQRWDKRFSALKNSLTTRLLRPPGNSRKTGLVIKIQISQCHLKYHFESELPNCDNRLCILIQVSVKWQAYSDLSPSYICHITSIKTTSIYLDWHTTVSSSKYWLKYKRQYIYWHTVCQYRENPDWSEPT